MKVLILTYYWPPSGGSGVQRWMYFAKYLQEFGVEPVVVTVDEQYASFPGTDHSLVEKIKHVRVYKTKTLEPLRFYSFLKSGNSKKAIPMGNVGGKKKGVIDKFATYVRGNFFIPDARIGWNRYAYSQATELLNKEHFDLVITTGPPHSTHLVGLKLKEKCNVKWVADFRDPWTEIYYYDLFQRTEKKKQKDLKLEMSVLEKADAILTVGPSMQQLLEKKIPQQPGKVSFIFNGFDNEKTQEASLIDFQKFTIAYIGTLSSGYPYQSFIHAFQNWQQANPDRPVQIVLAGKIEGNILADFQSLHSDLVEINYKGTVSHIKALSLMKSAHLLLLCLPIYAGSSIFVSGKLMEYIACGRPILGILNPESDAGFLVKNYTTGQVFMPEQEDQITHFIDSVVQGKLENQVTNKDLSEFERKTTAKQLAQYLLNLKYS